MFVKLFIECVTKKMLNTIFSVISMHTKKYDITCLVKNDNVGGNYSNI